MDSTTVAIRAFRVACHCRTSYRGFHRRHL